MKSFCHWQVITMVIEWREHEHEGADNQDLSNPATIDALWQCGFLKYFKMATMRSETRILQLLIGYWDPERTRFPIDDEPIPFKVKDIYFLIGLYHRGR